LQVIDQRLLQLLSLRRLIEHLADEWLASNAVSFAPLQEEHFDMHLS